MLKKVVITVDVETGHEDCLKTISETVSGIVDRNACMEVKQNQILDGSELVSISKVSYLIDQINGSQNVLEEYTPETLIWFANRNSDPNVKMAYLAVAMADESHENKVAQNVR